MEYDVVVIVGTRVAGAATAMLLARQGLRVLAVDRARFPSDTLSSHQVQVPGAALLHEWGVLDTLTAAGTPATPTVSFDAGPAVLRGSYHLYQGFGGFLGNAAMGVVFAVVFRRTRRLWPLVIASKPGVPVRLKPLPSSGKNCVAPLAANW